MNNTLLSLACIFLGTAGALLGFVIWKMQQRLHEAEWKIRQLLTNMVNLNSFACDDVILFTEMLYELRKLSADPLFDTRIEFLLKRLNKYEQSP